VLVDQIAAGDVPKGPFKTGTVTAFSGGLITATIDGATVENIHRLAEAYASPANGHNVLIAVVRHTTGAVQYVALGVIT